MPPTSSSNHDSTPSSAAPPPPFQTAHPKSPPLPPHNAPRVWLLTAGASPIGISVARQALKHGDCVIAALSPVLFSPSLNEPQVGDGGPSTSSSVSAGEDVPVTTAKEGPLAGFTAFVEELRGAVQDGKEGAGLLRRLRVVRADGKVMAQCQSAIAEATAVFGRVDIVLCCDTQTILGSTEELSATPTTLSLIRSQFETTYFSTVNIIRALLPSMRARNNGHIILLSGTSGNFGSPGMGIYCASQWAVEAFCDSLAYEVAPFNIKVTIVQPNMEIPILTNKITSVAAMPQYSGDVNPAAPAQEVIGGLLSRLTGTSPPDNQQKDTPQMTHAQTQLQTQTPSPFSTPSPATATTPSTSAASPSNRQQHQQQQQHRTALSSIASQKGVTATSASSSAASASGALHGGGGGGGGSSNSSSNKMTSTILTPLPSHISAALVAETAYALLAIGGHDNPPARHIVGFEGVAATKEKLRQVTEEMEEFGECGGLGGGEASAGAAGGQGKGADGGVGSGDGTFERLLGVETGQ